ncbi:M48 family metalloprotease [Streptomyces hesseae]|uniref:M48 family metalloprotease n=1 Tax=Streptomyces hesseae TaxID=3075519 RepID=A0ABU2SU14_9ACTN|nr:M48 family metalloprotease [Streptomyces sp. DSM 40473]MDT0452499.1 M48 family metalloprotease [Streptomyces sp. DSM 40473]
MGTSLRALRALALLAGFYLLVALVLGVLVGVDVAATLWAPAGLATLKVYFLSVVLAVPVLRGVFLFRTAKAEGPGGLAVTEAEQPELWRTVRSLAERTGTRAPDAIVLTGDVNAGVAEDARLLGLLPGPRRLYLGVPLLTGLTEAQLHAVIAHELAHHGNTDTRLAGIALRGRDSVLRTAEAFREQEERRIADERARQEKEAEEAVRRGRKPKKSDTGRAGKGYGLMAKPFLAYAGLYLRVTHGDGRRQELAADRLAARVAGRDATASALRETAVLDTAHDFYMSRYATAGVGVGLLPPRGEVFGGLRRLLTAPGRQENLAGLRDELPPAEPSPYDTHPPVAVRVELIEALPDDGRAVADARPALALLREPERVMADLEDAVLTPKARAMTRVDWPELVHRAVHAQTEAAAEPLRTALGELGATAPGAGALADLSTVLDLADAGRLWEVADHLPKSPEAARAQGRAAREFARPALYAGLRELAELALVESAGARWELSWSGPAELRLPDGGPADGTVAEAVTDAVRPIVEDVPDTKRLRELIALPTLISPTT